MYFCLFVWEMCKPHFSFPLHRQGINFWIIWGTALSQYRGVYAPFSLCLRMSDHLNCHFLTLFKEILIEERKKNPAESVCRVLRYPKRFLMIFISWAFLLGFPRVKPRISNQSDNVETKICKHSKVSISNVGAKVSKKSWAQHMVPPLPADRLGYFGAE